MIGRDDDRKVTRILVVLDASEQSRAAIDAAARLAAELHAELVGLFVEETDFMRFAALPSGGWVVGALPVDRPVSAAAMRRAIRAQAESARASLAHAAERLRLSWSFRTVTGSVRETLEAESSRCDVVAVSRSRRHREPAWSRLTQCSVLLVRAERPVKRPVVLCVERGAEALDTAIQIAKASRRPLSVFAPDTGKSSAKATKGLVDRLGRSGLPFEARSVDVGDIAGAARAIRLARPGLLILEREGVLAAALDLEELADQIDCPVLLLS